MNDKHEKAIVDLYRQSRTEQPSEFMDKRIRRAAKRKLYKSRKQWVWSLSTAAVLVLSFTVVLNLLDVESEISQIVEQEELKRQVIKKNRVESQQRVVPKFAPILESQPLILEEQHSMQDFASERTQNLQQRKRKLLSRPRHQKEKAESLSFDAVVSSGAGLSDSENVKIHIPQLPLTLGGLLDLDNSLQGEKLKSGLIKLYLKNLLILTLLPGESEFTFKAWPGSEILGVEVDWSVTEQNLDNCNELTGQTVCSLSDQVKAVYIFNQLDHILWSVNRE
ncbi:MAG: hypothetical protein HOM14_16560 [Gammaproteobacteria bacterium]|jgi:hypothetical protein|nr:hypothetical protein [Gammaproteobacteria bacterium]MBT3723250.1 hypothetical protein [Gammaproteobacteria bacterium]MBT4077823.1 hypothetical protein [Gammaproteobacteria bacterium]MBT4196498.1 hypothetical protein [Gammaproteobacteria bacterium]MBT4450184.1 hypothetical protein [Gammaproteobacteria bacterium]